MLNKLGILLALGLVGCQTIGSNIGKPRYKDYTKELVVGYYDPPRFIHNGVYNKQDIERYANGLKDYATSATKWINEINRINELGWKEYQFGEIKKGCTLIPDVKKVPLSALPSLDDPDRAAEDLLDYIIELRNSVHQYNKHIEQSIQLAKQRCAID